MMNKLISTNDNFMSLFFTANALAADVTMKMSIAVT